MMVKVSHDINHWQVCVMCDQHNVVKWWSTLNKLSKEQWRSILSHVSRSFIHMGMIYIKQGSLWIMGKEEFAKAVGLDQITAGCKSSKSGTCTGSFSYPSHQDTILNYSYDKWSWTCSTNDKQYEFQNVKGVGVLDKTSCFILSLQRQQKQSLTTPVVNKVNGNRLSFSRRLWQCKSESTLQSICVIWQASAQTKAISYRGCCKQTRWATWS